jgi:hypothetical protein
MTYVTGQPGFALVDEGIGYEGELTPLFFVQKVAYGKPLVIV